MPFNQDPFLEEKKRRGGRKRLRDYDYNRPGYYFVTFCIENMVEVFGEVVAGEMQLNEYGEIAEKYWQMIPQIYANVELLDYVIMPNHIHAIIHILYSNETEKVDVNLPGKDGHYGQVSKIIKGFKDAVTTKIRERFDDNEFTWERSFHDSIIWYPESADLLRIKMYIKNNPKKYNSENYKDL